MPTTARAAHSLSVSTNVILLTGASTTLGQRCARSLALAGHTVYAALPDTSGHNATHVEEFGYFAKDYGVTLRVLDMDTQSQESVDTAVGKVFDANGRIDVVVHAEPDGRRVNHAVLPHLRERGQGALIWVSGGSAADELADWGIDTTIVEGTAAEADTARLADAVTKVVAAPVGQRPHRVHIDRGNGPS